MSLPPALWRPLGALLGLLSTVNHYLTFWPRLRLAVAFVLIALPAIGLALWLLRRAERRYGIASRLVRRTGEARLLFAGVLLTFVASSGGHLYTPDEWMVYAAGVGLAHHGVPAAFADEPYPLHLLTSPIAPRERAADGTYQHAYSKYGVTVSALVTPLYALGRLLGNRPDLPPQAFPYGSKAVPLVPLLLNPLVTAATAALVFAAARALGYRRHSGLIAALAFAFGSLAWVYSKTLMSLAPAALFAAAGLYALQRAGQASQSRRSRWIGLAGVSAALSIATRYEMWLFCAPLVVLLFAGRPSRREALRRAFWFGVPFLVVAIPLVLGVNLMRTGDIFETGYGGEGQLTSITAKPWYGWFGILVSPGCGLVTHTPLMALGLIGLIWLWEDSPSVALAAGGGALLAIAYYGAFDTWCGFTAWGPRYLVNVGPFMALPLAAIWQRTRRAGAGRNPFIWLLGGGLALWSTGTNLLAVLIDFNHGWQDHWAHNVTYLEVTWLPYFSGITSHVRLLREWLLDGRVGIDLYLWHVLGPAGPLVTGLLVTAALGCFASLWLAKEEVLIEGLPGVDRGASVAPRIAPPARPATAPQPAQPRSTPAQSIASAARS